MKRLLKDMDGERAAAALAVLALVPALCVVIMYLAAADPFGGVQQVPAVVVNLDAGTQEDGEERNYGQELCDLLIQSASAPDGGEITGFSWVFTNDEAQAAAGLADGTYYLELVIPQNFSAALASGGAAEVVQAELQAYYNPAINYTVQVIGQGVVDSIVDAVSRDVSEARWSDALITVQDASDSLETFTSAGQDLTDGLVEAQEGSAQLADGMEQLQAGSQELADGLVSAATGAESLASGTAQLVSGVEQLADGLRQLRQGIEESAQSPETQALSEALAQVGSCLQLFAQEYANESPNEELMQSYLADASAAASAAAAANATLGDPLVAYIAGGTFSYTANGQTTTSTEKGLIPALAEYTAAAEALAAFEGTELESLLSVVKQLAASLDDMGLSGEQTEGDLQTYSAAVESVARCRAEYREALAAYELASMQYATGCLTQEEFDAASASVAAADAMLAQAESTLDAASSQLNYDLYHLDEEGNPAGLLPTLKQAGASSVELISAFSSFDEIEALVDQLITLITNAVTAGAAAQGAAGKCEGYLVGVAVTSAYASASTTQLAEAVALLSDAVSEGSGDTLLSGQTALASGADQLASGLESAASGGQSLTDGLASAAEGAVQLADGLETASDTSAQLFARLLEGRNDLVDGLASSQDAAALASPVLVNGEDHAGESISTMASYGDSMVPYYLCIGLWVSCLLALIMLPGLREEGLVRRYATVRETLACFVPTLVLALAEALIALLVAQFGLGVSPAFVPAYYAFGLLAAAVIATMVQLLCRTGRYVGLLLAVGLLVVQLPFCSGVFVAESGIAGIGAAAQFFPVTQVVRGLRICIGGVGLGYLVQPVLVLAAYEAAFALIAALTCVFATKKPLGALDARQRGGQER